MRFLPLEASAIVANLSVASEILLCIIASAGR